MRILDLFSGIGGFSLGLERAGFETAAFCEIEPYPVKVLQHHWSDVPVFGDVQKLYRMSIDMVRCPDCCDELYCELCETHFFECDCYGCSQFDDEVGEIDIITAGFPCQDVSYLNDIHGEGKGVKGERSGLYIEAMRLVERLRPGYVIFENVEALIKRGLIDILRDLAACGYDAEWHVIPASAVGGEHQRNRVWIIAYDQSLGVEGLWPEGVKIPHSMERAILPLRGSDGEWQVEPDFRRTDDGLSRSLDKTPRLKACGNAIVPQIAELIGRRIRMIELEAGRATF